MQGLAALIKIRNKHSWSWEILRNFLIKCKTNHSLMLVDDECWMLAISISLVRCNRCMFGGPQTLIRALFSHSTCFCLPFSIHNHSSFLTRVRHTYSISPRNKDPSPFVLDPEVKWELTKTRVTSNWLSSSKIGVVSLIGLNKFRGCTLFFYYKFCIRAYCHFFYFPIIVNIFVFKKFLILLFLKYFFFLNSIFTNFNTIKRK